MTIRSDSSSGHWKAYPEYKDSGIEWLGEIPKEWNFSNVQRNYEIQLGKMLQNSSDSEEDIKVPYLKAMNVTWQHVELNDLLEMWASPNDLIQYNIIDGDLLVCEGGEVGRSGIVNNPPDRCVIQNALHRVRSRGNADLNFLQYVMIGVNNSGWFDVLCNKATISHFTREKFAELKIPIPSLPEQKSIASFLDERTARIDATIEKKERQIELLKEKRSALISHAVTKGLDPDAEMKDSGVEWLGEIPVGWSDPHQIRRLVKFHKQGYYTNEQYVDDGVKLLRITDIDDFGNVYLDNCPFLNVSDKDKDDYQVKIFDFLFARSGSIGRFGIVRKDVEAIFASYLINFRFFNVDIEFLKFFFFSNCFKDALISELHGGANQNVHAENIKNQYISCPPLPEQKAIAAFLDRETARIDGLVGKVEASVSMLKEYRAALISAAVTGKIDVRDYAKEGGLSPSL